jgi:hypothetical protein
VELRSRFCWESSALFIRADVTEAEAEAIAEQARSTARIRYASEWAFVTSFNE